MIPIVNGLKFTNFENVMVFKTRVGESLSYSLVSSMKKNLKQESDQRNFA